MLRHTGTGQIETAFFSIINVDLLQDRIRDSVKHATGTAISRQSDTELVASMYTVYSSRHHVQTVAQLNARVVEECTRVIIENMRRRDVYLAKLRENGKLQMDARPVHSRIKMF